MCTPSGEKGRTTFLKASILDPFHLPFLLFLCRELGKRVILLVEAEQAYLEAVSLLKQATATLKESEDKWNELGGILCTLNFAVYSQVNKLLMKKDKVEEHVLVVFRSRRK